MNDAPHALPPPDESGHESRLHLFVSSLGHLLRTMVEMGFTRLELLAVELQEWVEGLVRIFFWAMVMIFAAGAGLLIGALALIYAFWEHRLLVALLELGTFVLLAIGALLMMMRRLHAHRSLLATTFGEFAKDRELFRASSLQDVPDIASAMSPAPPAAASAQAPPL